MKLKNSILLFVLFVPLCGYFSAAAAAGANSDIGRRLFVAENAAGENYSSATLKTYAVPAGYPQEGAPLFNVSANNKFTGVYTDINAWEKLVSFAYFDFAPGAEAEVTITRARDFTSYKILPESTHVSATREGRTLRFKLSKTNTNLSVVFDDDYKGETLHLFANEIDAAAPSASDENLIYFGPGWHDLQKLHGGTLVTGGRNVYIAGGAVVNGDISVTGDGTTVSGRGILMKTVPGGLVMTAYYARNVTYDGFIACSHCNPGWTLGMHEADGVTVQNVKVVSTRYASTDGFDIVNSRNIRLKNVFIRACDDAITIKGLVGTAPAQSPPNENMLFEHLQIWNDCNNAMCLGEESKAKYYRNIQFRDIDVIFSYDDRDHHGKLDERSVMTICALHGTWFRDVLWENIRVNRCERLICLTFKDSFWFGSIKGDQTHPGGIENIVFKNVSVASVGDSKIAGEILLNGHPGEPEKRIKNIVFDHVVVNGRKLGDARDPLVKTNNTKETELVANLVFK